MARIAGVVAPGIPHHVTQRGNRRQSTFFQPSDWQAERARILFREPDSPEVCLNR